MKLKDCLKMQFNWLNKQNNSKLIVFLNGWGMNRTAISHLACEDFDILEINDYRNFELFTIPQTYCEKYLIAWSMGVYVSNLFYEAFKDFTKKIAIAGTSNMIDDNFGIPTKIYKITVKLFNEASCQKFLENMFNGDVDSKIKIEKSIDELKEELISIQNLKINHNLSFDKAIIPLKDKIVPSKNQLNFWQNNSTTLEKINSSHYPFNCYKSWSEILC